MKVGQILREAPTIKEAVFMSFRDCFECEYFKEVERRKYQCVNPIRRAVCREIFEEFWSYPVEPEEQAKANDDWRRAR